MEMEIIKYSRFKPLGRIGASVAMGNFDGIHLGHKSVIELAKTNGESMEFGVLTFTPHPREFFSPENKHFKLMNYQTKILTLKKLNLDILIEIPFNASLSKLEPEIFAREILHRNLCLGHVVVGSDFRFGKNRIGDAESLARFGERYGFKVTVAPLKQINGLEISSTAIRKLLTKGQTEKAATMLGDWYKIAGKVIKGDQRGRELGFPTINISLENLHLPKYGVYTSSVEVLSGKHKGNYEAVVSIGERPTYGINSPNLEAHLIEFTGNLYNTEVLVELKKFQRPEVKFLSSSDLKNQMLADLALAKVFHQDFTK